jgi:hypothetical protein
MVRLAVLLCTLAAPFVAVAADFDLEAVDACLIQSVDAGQPPSSCMDTAHAECMATDNEAPAVATLCFVEAERIWQTGISDLVQRISEKAPEEITTIARIEAKYDLLSALLQCSRIEDLSLAVGRETEANILRRNARCKSNAAGLTYTRLFLRSRDMR